LLKFAWAKISSKEEPKTLLLLVSVEFLGIILSVNLSGSISEFLI
jgi:hypothetical protein